MGDGQTVHSRCRYELDDGTVVEQPRLLDRPTGGSYTEPVEMPPQAEWLTPAQARKYVGEIGTTEDRDGFAHLCDIGEGPPGVRFGGGIRYQRTEVDAWLTSRAADHDPDEGET